MSNWAFLLNRFEKRKKANLYLERSLSKQKGVFLQTEIFTEKKVEDVYEFEKT
jgi:hypothetical protein